MSTTARFVERRLTPRTGTTHRPDTTARLHRERDFGVGYGSSSGYRGKANYTRAWRPSLFKFG